MVWGLEGLQPPGAPTSNPDFLHPGFLLGKIIHTFLVEARIKSVLLLAVPCIPN